MQSLMSVWFCQAVILPWGWLFTLWLSWGCQLVRSRLSRRHSLAAWSVLGAFQGRNQNGSVFSFLDWVYSAGVLHTKWAALCPGTVGRISFPTVMIPLASSSLRRVVPVRAWWYVARALDWAWADSALDCTLTWARLAAMMACWTWGSRALCLVCACCRMGSRFRCLSRGGCRFGFHSWVEGLAVEARLRSAWVQTFHRVVWSPCVRSPRNFRS